MLDIRFKYKDKYSKGKWSTQSCSMNSVSECIKWYGLGVDCEYEITDVRHLINNEEDFNKYSKDESFVIYVWDNNRGLFIKKKKNEKYSDKKRYFACNNYITETKEI